MPKYIDIHCHTNFKIFENDRDEVIRRALDNDTWLINIGTQYDTSKKAVEMTREYPDGVFATIGLHPIHTDKSYHDESEIGEGGQEFSSRGEIFDKEKYKELAKQGKVVGIGECGLDYYHIGSTSSPQRELEFIEKQKTAFIAQIELANELDLPLMLHVRNGSLRRAQCKLSSPQATEKNAYFDVYELLKKYSKRINEKGLPAQTGVSHFFAGSVEDMKRFIEIGVYISFAGPITYKPKPEICDYIGVIKETSLDMILADTDSPYVAPVPHRGERNEPVNVSDIVAKIAEIKGISEAEASKSILSNAQKLFNI